MSDQPCRRRPILAARGKSDSARGSALPPSVLPAVETKPAARPRGACPHCGRHIGRGVNFHAQYCAMRGCAAKKGRS